MQRVIYEAKKGDVIHSKLDTYGSTWSKNKHKKACKKI